MAYEVMIINLSAVAVFRWVKVYVFYAMKFVRFFNFKMIQSAFGGCASPGPWKGSESLNLICKILRTKRSEDFWNVVGLRELSLQDPTGDNVCRYLGFIQRLMGVV